MSSAEPPSAELALKIHWASKVRPEKIRQLYDRDALGIVDADLIDDVGLALHARCASIVLVNDGMVRCPRCGTVFKVHRTYRERAKGEPVGDPERVVPCPQPACGWQTTAAQWGQSWRHRELHAGWGLPPIREYAERYPLATTPRQRMLLIDQFLHAFHHDLRNAAPHRSVAHNLVEGNHRQALALLDSLAYGERSTPEVSNIYAAWAARGVRRRRQRARPLARRPVRRGPPERRRGGRTARRRRLGGRARSAAGADPVPRAADARGERDTRRPAAVRNQRSGARSNEPYDERQDRDAGGAGPDGSAAEAEAEGGAGSAARLVRQLASL